MNHTPFSRKQHLTVSLIVPFFNEVESIPHLHKRLSDLSLTMPERVEVIFVNDGSTDRGQEALEALEVVHYDAHLINLSRNFGKEAAMQAGFDHCKGDVVIQLDADLQDPPELIPRMLEAYYQGADVVNMRRSRREGESLLKSISARMYHRFLNKITDDPIPVDVGDFRLLSRRVVDHINNMPERNRYMKGILSWPGFNQVTLEFDRPARLCGKTKWSAPQLVSLALAGITAFSNKPLRMIVWLGLGVITSAVAYGAILFLQALLAGRAPLPYQSILLLQLSLGGVHLLAVGVIGEYIGRILTEARQRPLYVVMDQSELNPAQQYKVRKLG